jgi:Phosphodiester glycosidase
MHGKFSEMGGHAREQRHCRATVSAPSVGGRGAAHPSDLELIIPPETTFPHEPVTSTDNFVDGLLDEDGSPLPPAPLDVPRPRAGHPRRRRIFLTVLAVAAMMMVLPVSSLVTALRTPGNLTAGERSVEWMRDHNLGGIINPVEQWWFSNHAPKQGGEPDRGITIAAPPDGGKPDPSPSGPSGTEPVVSTPRPADVAVPNGIAPLPNEGIWQAVGPTFGGAPAMYGTQVRPDSIHTSLLDGLVWIDPKLARFEVHPGLQEPGGAWATPAQVPVDERLALLAAFNGGFRMQDARGGFYLDGKVAKPLRDGAASFVVTKDGVATVGQWGRDVKMGPDVVAVRQNLDLIVDGGQPVPGLDDNSNGKFGATLGNKVLVWRSAVCVDAAGGIIYGYGDGLGALSLAQLMTRAGCQRAMELDINPSWTSFNFYGASTPGDPATLVGTKLLPDQHKPGSRYLSNDSRDFVAVLSREN